MAFQMTLTTGVAYLRSLAVGALSGVISPSNLNAANTITSTGNQAAIDPTGYTTIRANNATLLTIQGIVAGVAGQKLTIYSVGAGQVDIANQSGSASAGNKIANQVTGTISLAAGVGRVSLEYDATAAEWKVLQHEQGDWITPAFNAGDFTANGSMTWTVAAGDVTCYAYYLRGRMLTVMFRIQTTTVGGTPNTNLQLKIPGGFTTVGASLRPATPIRIVDSGATAATGSARLGSANIQLSTTPAGATNWSAATDTTEVEGEITLAVQ